jgi:hypothetical protein
MKMLLCCLVLMTLVGCEQPQRKPPERPVPTRVAPIPPPSSSHERHERTINEVQQEVRRLKELLEKKDQ